MQAFRAYRMMITLEGRASSPLIILYAVSVVITCFANLCAHTITVGTITTGLSTTLAVYVSIVISAL
jgi:hypothetical protein